MLFIIGSLISRTWDKVISSNNSNSSTNSSNSNNSKCDKRFVRPATAEGALRVTTTFLGLLTCSGHIVPSVEPLALQDTIIIIVRAVMERDMFTATTKKRKV